ncbi:MAG: pyrimidine dimer DNA glycosylase/endonuclease V [bacterium]
MRVWDISPKKLCASHLLGEHVEIHAIWSVITKNKKGYSRHPETNRWRGKLKALYLRHETVAEEMQRRGYNHKSKLNQKLATGEGEQRYFLNSPQEQKEILRKKKCACRV